jgi:hypothetical protein
MGYAMYIAISRFDSIAIGLSQIPHLLSGFVTVNALGPYSSRTSTVNQIRAAANLGAALLVLPLIVFYGLKHSPLLSASTKHALRLMPLALIPFVAVTYAAGGGFGYGTEYGLVLSIVGFPLLALQRNLRRYVAILLVVAVVTGTIAFAADENLSINFVTYEESAASSWLLVYAPTDSGVFTDYRLSGPLLGGGYAKTTGLSQQSTNDSAFIALFQNIYCARNGSASVSAIRFIRYFDGSSPRLIFFSTEMERNVPGVRVYGLGLKACSNAFLGRYDTTQLVSKVYSDGSALVYSVN